MKPEVIDPVIDRLVKEKAASMPTPPKKLRETYESYGGWTGAVGGALEGATIGANVGLALGPFGAMAGTVPGAIIGGVIGYFGGAKAGQQVEKTPQPISRSDQGNDD